MTTAGFENKIRLLVAVGGLFVWINARGFAYQEGAIQFSEARELSAQEVREVLGLSGKFVGSLKEKSRIRPGEPAVKVFRLVSVGPGEPRGPIQIGVGDMLQLAPFQTPVTPQSLGAKVKVELKGDRVLEMIGQTSVGLPGEGASRNCVFLYARSPGKVCAILSLHDARGQAIDGEAVRYDIRVNAAVQEPPVQTPRSGS